MSDKIPGVPEGWELVAIRKPVRDVDHIVGPDLEPVLCDHVQQNFNCVIIRKIEKPAAYRPFESAEEYLPYWGKPIRMKGGAGFDSVTSTSECTVYVNSGPARVQYTMADAFEQLAFADGTPFGVKIDE
jgi:hypothetical protein